jgi:hypothetical protein
MAEREIGDVTAVDVPSRYISMISFARDSVTEVNRVAVRRKCRNLARRSLCALTPYVLANHCNGVQDA